MTAVVVSVLQVNLDLQPWDGHTQMFCLDVWDKQLCRRAAGHLLSLL